MTKQSLKEMRLKVSAAATLPEAEALSPLIEATRPLSHMQASIFSDAAFMLKRARALPAPAAETLLRQFRLDSAQGVALMRLVEALPRIPDTETAYALIEEIFSDPCWREEGHTREALLNTLAEAGLKFMHQLFEGGEGSFLKEKMRKLSLPLIHKALLAMAEKLGKSFVLGESVESGWNHISKLDKQEYLYSFDVLGEAARTDQQAKHYTEAYEAAIKQVAKHPARSEWLGYKDSVSIKLSALYPRFELTHRKLVQSYLYPRLRQLAQAAKQANILLTLDAEEASRFDLTLELYEQLLQEPSLQGFEGLGLALQAYQKRAYPALEYLAKLGEKTGRRLPIRLVKGAYWDYEIKQAQLHGLAEYPVFTRKAHTDLSFLACALRMLDFPDQIYSQFATHNAHSIAAILRYVKPHNRYEFQKLHGMGDRLHAILKEEQVCRIYAPVGDSMALLPYLIRRLLENGANSSFLNQFYVQANDAELLAFPTANSEPALPAPRLAAEPSRAVAAGIDLGSIAALNKLKQSVAPFQAKHWLATPIINGKAEKTGESARISSPSNIHAISGECHYATEMEVMKAVTLAKSGYLEWRMVEPAKRAAILKKAASLLEKQQAEALALLVYEAGKTLQDALAEIRETIDFLNYYAASAIALFTPQTQPGITGEQNQLYWRGKGVFLSISPWNFPLAIFTGQVAAALVSGNSVVAKPAEQTPLIAHFMTQLFLKAGIPPYALQLLPGSGNTVGQRLVEDLGVQGVVFTGSSETAQRIAQSLAKRQHGIVPLIAETGGQNAMILDTSALPEQAVQDILLSAFGAAGQRCSALRVLYVPEEIAASFLPLLKGAAEQLAIGFPEDLDTDIASVINPEAQLRIQRHIDHWRSQMLFEVPVPALAARKGCYVPLTALRLQSISQLQGEVFGPVLHVITYRWADIDRILAEINATGYALTFGIHTRLQSRVQHIARRIEAGNLYINRGLVGAVVGQQPFGGHHRSGTGFKAGGPHYLLRFAHEMCQTTNQTAFGGNVQLLGGHNGI